ncbi:MAG: phosphatidylserine decarboxylase [Archaeoglobaceae archaeon]
MALIEKSGARVILLEIALVVVFYFISQAVMVLLLLFLAFTIFFFRDPPREIGEGIVSPAYGKVDRILGNKLEIFMSPFDCHVNVAPVDGRIERTNHINGPHFPAFMRKENAERNEIYISNEDGEFKVTQITGMLARRIVCYPNEGDSVTKGEKIGIIKFGSRTTLEIPLGYSFTTKVGEKIKAGETLAVKKNV